MIQLISDSHSVNTVSHLIQLSVAPVFLLAAVGSVLNVLTGRLARIIEKAEKQDTLLVKSRQENPLDKRTDDIRRSKTYLEKRAQNLNYAILSCTLTGVLVALVIMVMFLSAFLEFNGSLLIALFFILAMLSFIFALILFVVEVFMLSHNNNFNKHKKVI